MVLGAPVAPAGAVAAAVEIGFAPNYAKVNTERWRCRRCPFDAAERGEGSITAGVIEVEGPRPRFGRDSGLDEESAHAYLGVAYRTRDAAGRALEARKRSMCANSGEPAGTCAPPPWATP